MRETRHEKTKGPDFAAPENAVMAKRALLESGSADDRGIILPPFFFREEPERPSRAAINIGREGPRHAKGTPQQSGDAKAFVNGGERRPRRPEGKGSRNPAQTLRSSFFACEEPPGYLVEARDEFTDPSEMTWDNGARCDSMSVQLACQEVANGVIIGARTTASATDASTECSAVKMEQINRESLKSIEDMAGDINLEGCSPGVAASFSSERASRVSTEEASESVFVGHAQEAESEGGTKDDEVDKRRSTETMKTTNEQESRKKETTSSRQEIVECNDRTTPAKPMTTNRSKLAIRKLISRRESQTTKKKGAANLSGQKHKTKNAKRSILKSRKKFVEEVSIVYSDEGFESILVATQEVGCSHCGGGIRRR